MNRQEILTYIYQSDYINATLKTILKKSVGEHKYSFYYDDAKSHFLVCVSSIKEATLLRVFNEKGIKGIEHYCAGIINNQFASSTSSFYKQFRNPKVVTCQLWNIDNYREHLKDFTVDELSEQQDELIHQTLRKLADTPEEVLYAQHQKWKDDNITKIKNLLLHLPPELGLHCKIMFELYYFKDLTYQKIEEISGVNYQTVRLYVQKTLKHLKKELKTNI
ncbi:MAG: hypothetical protein BGO69_15800 [Bacteroidetes bacterium 46-16]|nr:MAG: hypothetical protein BGO69_15800 [Bacteroidetes bacterium 46-16]